MAVKIRLRRMASRNRPFYRVVVTDNRAPTDGRFIETIGWYNPVDKTGECRIKTDRLSYWTSVGAQMTTNVAALAKRAKPYEQEPADAPKDTAEETSAS